MARSIHWISPFLFCAVAMADTAPISDENLRVSALRAIFPGMQISREQGKQVDDSRPIKLSPYQLDSPDALAKENVYRVTGKPMNQVEREASEPVVIGKPSNTRLLRFRLFHRRGTGLLAVLQYKFEDTIPSMACPSIGLLVMLSEEAGIWAVGEQFLLETMHHFSLQTIRMLDLDGDGIDELVIESDFGGAETWGTNFLVFGLTASKFEEIFETTTRMAYSTDDVYKEELDVPRTLQQHGARFCFTKTTMIEAEETFRPPRMSKPCYRSNEGEYHQESEERNKMLRP